MGREEGQLWDDDSALINAFDQAISNYKKMHGKLSTENSAAVTVDGPTVVAAPHEDTSNTEAADDGISNASVVTVEVGESRELGTSKENEITNSQVIEEHGLGSDSLAFQDQTQNYCSPSDVEEYNRLYNQYYEIEEQRQQILQKLHHFGSVHDPQYDETSGLQWGTTATTQECQTTTTQMPCATTVVSASANAGSLPAFPSAGEDLEKKDSVENVDIVKTALRAAERALSTLKEQTSDSNKDNKICSTTEESAVFDTDLGTVLHAWYSAGFYTGKYLTEKSLAKKQHD